MRPTLIGAAVLLVAGCASTYTNIPVVPPTAKLVAGNAVLIATPANGSYGTAVYSSSGKMTADAVRAAFMRYAANATVVPNCRDLPCLEKAQTPAFGGYYVVPEILHWEDRATEWSGIPDRLEVKLLVYDSSKKEIAATIIGGKSKWATLGGDHPQDLLPEPLNKYVDSLYK
jgi:hypothetical protein